MTRSSDESDLQMDDVSKAYRSAMHDMLREEPSHAIDDAIRAAARRGVSAGPVPLNKSWFSRARFPLAAAATVLLTGSLIFIGMREDKKAITTLNESSSTAVSASLAKADAGVPDAKPVIPRETRAEMPAKSAPPKVELKQEKLIEPAKRKEADKTVAVSDSRARMEAPAQPFTRTLQAPVPASPAAAAAPPPPPAAVAPSPVVADAAPAKPLAAPAAATTAVPEPSPAPAAGVAPAPSAEKSLERRVMSANEAKRVEPAPMAFAPTPQAPDSPAAARSTLVESSDRWIARMETLQSEGKTEQLHRELKRFRKAYPSASLPTALQDEWVKIAE